MEQKTPQVLVAVANGCEDMEVVVPISILRKAGAKVMVEKVPEDQEDSTLECRLGRGTRIVYLAHMMLR